MSTIVTLPELLREIGQRGVSIQNHQGRLHLVGDTSRITPRLWNAFQSHYDTLLPLFPDPEADEPIGEAESQAMIDVVWERVNRLVPIGMWKTEGQWEQMLRLADEVNQAQARSSRRDLERALNRLEAGWKELVRQHDLRQIELAETLPF